MHFAFLCTDKPGALQVRLDTRPEHLAYLNKLNDEGKLAFAVVNGKLKMTHVDDADGVAHAAE